jgi:DnaJ-class molecular chaperone
MSTVKINCPSCHGTGLTGTANESVCSQCKGTGMISVNSTDSVATVSAASATPIVVIAPTAVPTAAVKILGRGK